MQVRSYCMRGIRTDLRRGAFLLGVFGCVCWFSVNTASAQIVNGNLWPNPRLTILTPTGGKVGSTFDVTFAGTELDRPEALIFSHPGIKAVIPPPPPPDPKAKPDPKKPDPGPPPVTKFSVTIAKDVPAGFYDARIVNKFGV